VVSVGAAHCGHFPLDVASARALLMWICWTRLGFLFGLAIGWSHAQARLPIFEIRAYRPIAGLGAVLAGAPAGFLRLR